jgi:hypothetical protein
MAARTILPPTIRTLMIAAAAGTSIHSPATAQDAPRPQLPADTADGTRPGDDARTCAEINDEAHQLLASLEPRVKSLAATSAGVQAIGAEGRQIVEDAVRRTVESQTVASAASGLANIVPGGAIVSGLIGSATSAATGVDHGKLVSDQQAVARNMEAQMAALKAQADAVLPDAMRLQHLNALQAQKGCGGKQASSLDARINQASVQAGRLGQINSSEPDPGPAGAHSAS